MGFVFKRKISEKRLDELKQKGLEQGMLGAEQLFRKPANWYALSAYSNPYKTVYSEMGLINNHKNGIMDVVSGKQKVFYGIGTGDTEMLPVIWDLNKHGSCDIIGIDVSEQFLRGFSQGLENIKLEFPHSKIAFKGLVSLFEDIVREDLHMEKEELMAHFCLGNTIGNFNQKEIFSIFDRNMAKEDVLVLGVQLNHKPQNMLLQYSKNPLIRKFVCDAIGKGVDLNWRYDRSNGCIEAWVDDLQVFRSKKYDVDKLVKFAHRFGLQKIHSFSVRDYFGGFGLVVLKKI